MENSYVKRRFSCHKKRWNHLLSYKHQLFRQTHQPWKFCFRRNGALAYNEASQTLSDAVITIDNVYSHKNILPHEKIIILLNFRDNGLYFKNPIYLRKGYFSYFLSEHEELKFDIDDLFYYSSHKIQKRQGHLFVSDYGMQYSILSR